MAVDHRNQRLLRYALVGIPFGLLLWYSPMLFAVSGLHLPVLFRDDLSNPWLLELRRWYFYLAWLLPALLVAGFEIRASRAPVRSALAVVLFWLGAVVAHHAWWVLTLLLGFGGPQLLVRPGAGWATWWDDVRALRGVFESVLVHGVAWGIGATAGGLVVGYVVGVLLVRLTPGRTARSA